MKDPKFFRVNELSSINLMGWKPGKPFDYTPEVCIAECGRLGFKYAGLSMMRLASGSPYPACGCGHSVDGMIKDDKACTTKCPALKGPMCAADQTGRKSPVRSSWCLKDGVNSWERVPTHVMRIVIIILTAR